MESLRHSDLNRPVQFDRMADLTMDNIHIQAKEGGGGYIRTSLQKRHKDYKFEQEIILMISITSY